MKKVIPVFLLCGSLWLCQAQAQAPQANDWPQAGKDPQHTGYSAEALGTVFRNAWAYSFQPDKISPQVQAIVYRGKVFVGTQGANGQRPALYAIDAVNPEPSSNPARGRLIWKYDALSGAILNSAAADSGKVFFGAMDGAVYAVWTDSENGHIQGTLAWKQQLSNWKGFSTAVVIADNKVMLGGRDGYFYALDPADGRLIWKYRIGAPILQTAAYNNGKVFFGATDMFVYALNTSPSDPQDPAAILAWRGAKVPQMAFADYWPVVHQGRVIIRPLGLGGIIGVTDLSDSAQNAALARYDANPSAYPHTLLIYDENSGQELPAVIHVNGGQTHGGATAPPCVDRDGFLIIPAHRPDNYYAGGWGRLNLSTRKITEILINPNDPSEGVGNWDESLSVSCAANAVVSMHFHDHGATTGEGVFNLDTKDWISLSYRYIKKEMQLNNQGPIAPAIVSDGRIYFISLHELMVWSGQ